MAATGSTETTREMSQDGADITASAALMPSGGWGIRGWLSSLYAKIVNAIDPNGIVIATLRDSNNVPYDVQHPIPTDGDSVYHKDLDFTSSTAANFIKGGDPLISEEDVIKSIVSDVYIAKVNSTSDAVKTILFEFNRPILTTSFGINSGPGGYFSNTKITLSQGNYEWVVADESADSTNYEIRLFPTVPVKFSRMKIEFYTVNTVSIGLVGIFKNIEVASRIQALSNIDNVIEDVSSYRSALNVNAAYVHRKIVNQFFSRATGVATTLAVAASTGNTSVTVASATGFAIGNEVKITENGTEEVGIMTVTNVVGDVITLDRPLGMNYTTAADVTAVTTQMAVAGTLAAPIIFSIAPPSNTIWQLLQYNIIIIAAGATDDSLFGDLAALTNGVCLRATTAAGRTAIFANWKNNGAIRLDSGVIEHSDKAGGGKFSVGANWFAAKNEVAGEIDGSDPLQKFEVIIQDNLSTLSSFRIKAQGRVFSP